MPKKINRLGSGIDALLGSLEITTNIHNTSLVQMIPLERITTNTQQPRQVFHEETLQELAQSIKQQGVLQPILLEEYEDGYRIVAGERRFRAAQIAKLSEIPALVRAFTNEERLIVSLLENIQRENISAMEEAQAYKQLMDAAQLSQQELADRLGKSRSAVANTLRLLNLPEIIQQAVARGELSAGHARTLLSLDNAEAQEAAFREVLNKKLSVRDLEQKAVSHSNISKKTNLEEKLETAFQNKLNTAVIVKMKKASGTIQIKFQNKSDLSRIAAFFDIDLEKI